jgi:hypothetical protein
MFVTKFIIYIFNLETRNRISSENLFMFEIIFLIFFDPTIYNSLTDKFCY